MNQFDHAVIFIRYQYFDIRCRIAFGCGVQRSLKAGLPNSGLCFTVYTCMIHS